MVSKSENGDLMIKQDHQQKFAAQMEAYQKSKDRYSEDLSAEKNPVFKLSSANTRSKKKFMLPLESRRFPVLGEVPLCVSTLPNR